jgi:hypothetical protein
MSLEMYTVYFNAADFPGKYVVRRCVVGGEDGIAVDAEPLCVADDLSAARVMLHERGLCCLRRDQHDDPVIVEVWL